MRPARAVFAAGVLLATSMLWLAAGCGPSDPRAKVLQQRARWKVTLLSFSQQPQTGTILLSTRLSGPPNSTLQRLTVRIQLSDGDGIVVDRVWHTFDLADVQRGGPADRTVRIPDVPHEIDGAGVDMVLDPSPEEQARIAELQDLS